MQLKNVIGGETVVGRDVQKAHEEPIVLPKEEIDRIFIEVLVHILTLAFTLLNTIMLIVILAYLKL